MSVHPEYGIVFAREEAENFYDVEFAIQDEWICVPCFHGSYVQVYELSDDDLGVGE